jgi:hypothetical protein
LVQKLAEFYGERNAFEAAFKDIMKVKNPKNREVLVTMLRLYGLDIVKRELGYLMYHEVVGQKAAENINETFNKLVKSLAQDAPTVIEGLNVPTFALHTPIAGDYVAYNDEKNLGEVKGHT